MWPFDIFRKKNQVVDQTIVGSIATQNTSLNEGLAVKGQLYPSLSIVGGDSLKNSDPDEIAKNYYIAAAYVTIYTQVSRERREMVREVEKLRDFYLVDVMINQFTDDALSPDITTGDVLSIASDNNEIDKELKALEKRLKLDSLIRYITPDLCLYGEYTLRTKIGANKGNKKSESLDETDILNEDTRKKKLYEQDDDVLKKRFKSDENGGGLLELIDDVEQDSVISLTKNGDTVGYLIVDSKGRPKIKQECDYVKFTLSGKKIRIDVFKEFDEYMTKKLKDLDIPRYIRVGKSLMYPVRSKIKELELLEKLIPATKISKLSSGSIIGVQVPPGHDVDNAFKAVKRIEGMINKKIGLDTTEKEISIEDIMSGAGRIKCVPLFGDKGTLQKMDYKPDEPDDLLGSAVDVRRIILESVGIPYELIFTNDSGSKGEVLKRYARYLRKLKAIQSAISEGVRQIIYIHLANKGISFTEEEIKVSFRNKLIEIDNLDSLEFLDTSVGMLNNVMTFVNELGDPESPLRNNVSLKPLIDFLNTQLRTVGLNGVLDPKKEIAGFLEPEEEM